MISVTLGAQNDQQVTFNYLLRKGSTVFPHCWRYCLLRGLHRLVDLRPVLAASSCFPGARERKIKRLENQLSPATDVAVARTRLRRRNNFLCWSCCFCFSCSRCLWLVYGPQKCATKQADEANRLSRDYVAGVNFLLSNNRIKR